MAVAEETAAAVPAAPAPPIPQRGEEGRAGPVFTVGNVLRFLLLIALAAFLLYYVGPRDIAETSLKVALAVVASAALWVGANLLFDQAYARWTVFNTIIGFVVGFLGFFVLQANGLLKELFSDRVEFAGQGVFDDVTGWRTQPFDINGPLWGLIGGGALALVMFLLSAPRQQLARLPLAIIGYVAFGVLLAYAFEESAWPEFEWAKLWICVAVGAGLFGLIGLWRYGPRLAPLSVISGVAVGWAVGAWGGGNVGAGNRTGVLLATVVPAVIFGVRFGLAAPPDPTKRRRIEQRSRSWIFLTPALFFVTVGLLIPLLRTIYLSFRSRNGSESVGWDNYENIFTNRNSVNLDNWQNIFTSQLFWGGVVVLGLGFLAGLLAGRRTAQLFERGPVSLGPILVGLFIVSCAVLSVLRGTIMNNIWWVIVVVSLATAFGLAVAVLADRSKGENGAKSLIFLPMAISFIGAGIIWRFVYQARDPSQDQTGVLNAIWVWLGEVSTSTTSRAIAVAVLALIGLGFIYLIKRGVDTKANTMIGFAAAGLIFVTFLIYRFVGPGLGGYVETRRGTVAEPVLFVQEPPFNNMWLMAVLIWVQTGFAMVILSAAIKAVPTDLIEAAKIDGATESQVFWRITLPQIAPTLGVVVTTLIVTVMKVFDIVYAMTNGNFGTQVIANEMFQRAFGQSNFGLGSALAVVLFISVLPVMWINIRRMQQQRV